MQAVPALQIGRREDEDSDGAPRESLELAKSAANPKQREAYLAKDAGSQDAFDQAVVDSLRARGKSAGISY